MTYDFKEARQCEKEKLNWKDFLPTFLMAVTVCLLFALVIWELGRVGGAIDQSFMATVQEMQQKSVLK